MPSALHTAIRNLDVITAPHPSEGEEGQADRHREIVRIILALARGEIRPKGNPA